MAATYEILDNFVSLMGELLRKFFAESIPIYVCVSCEFHLAKEIDLVSKLFQGQSGPAYLFESVYNIFIDEVEQERTMTTGRHRIRTIRCAGCNSPIGWTYIKAYTESQKYKEGKSIIERAYIKEIDNSAVSIPGYLLSSHDLITKLNYFHKPG